MTGYFPRKIDPVLEKWSISDHRKPLILSGARQTGKTSSIREFGKKFDLFVELNLERYADLKMVRSCNSTEELLEALSARHNLARFPRRTLIFLDEIQQSLRAVRWLRFFHEDHPELAVVAAGSLLETRLQDRGFSFPVGRVTFRTLRPFSFFEFIQALGKDVLARNLAKQVGGGKAIPAAVHNQAMELVRDYVMVGGMPEAVARWASGANMTEVRKVHEDLVQALAEDIHRYKGKNDLVYLEAAFENLAHHYGLRFKYENFAPGYASRPMKSAINRLERAMLLTRVWPTSSRALALRTRPRSAPKLLPLDIGIALHMMGPTHEHLRARPVQQIVGGRVAEMFVGQQLLASRYGPGEQIHFWVSESSRGNAETDFLIEGPSVPIPVEVKSGASGSLKSMHQFLMRAGLATGIRFWAAGLADEQHTVAMAGGRIGYRLLSLPLYAAETLDQLDLSA